jgi:hypothetical protein
MNDRHLPAEIADIGDDMRGKNDNHVLPDGAEQVVEADASSGSPADGSSTMMSRGLPSSACAIPKRCCIPPE